MIGCGFCNNSEAGRGFFRHELHEFYEKCWGQEYDEHLVKRMGEAIQPHPSFLLNPHYFESRMRGTVQEGLIGLKFVAEIFNFPRYSVFFRVQFR